MQLEFFNSVFFGSLNLRGVSLQEQDLQSFHLLDFKLDGRCLRTIGRLLLFLSDPLAVFRHHQDFEQFGSIRNVPVDYQIRDKVLSIKCDLVKGLLIARVSLPNISPTIY